MDLPEYARAVRRRWAWLVVPALLALSGAGWLAIASPPAYQSTATLYYVEPAQNLTAPITRLNSYAILATSEQLVETVRTSLRLSTPIDELADQLSARIDPETSILTVTASDTTADGARVLVAEASRQLVAMSDSLQNRAAGLPEGHLALSDSATPAVATAPAAAARTVSLGALLGVIVGVVIALSREATDPWITHTDQLRRLAPGWRVFRLTSGDEVLATPQASSRLRAMRTQILETDSDGSRVMVVTSCEEGDYVTGIADDIALSAGRASIDVTLVSAHVHPTRSSVAHWARAEPGLSSVLLGECPLDAAVITGPVTTVHLLSAGRSLSYPEALLTSKAMVAVVDDLQSRGSALLIDAPPLLAPPDTLGLVRATGAGVLLVVHAGRTRRRALRSAIRMLDAVEATVVGVVFVHRPARRGARGPAAGHGPTAPPASAFTHTPLVRPVTS